MMCGNDFMVNLIMMMSSYFLLICMIRSDSNQDGTGLGGAYAFNALLALWLIVLGDDAYMDK